MAHHISSSAALTLFVEHVATPTGPMLLLTDEAARVRALDWEDHAPRLHRLLRLHYGDNRTSLVNRARASEARAVLDRYFDGDLTCIATLDVATAGTAFQRDVWTALRTIPAGRTVSYSELALAIGRPKAVRAVGLANGSNPIGIIVPCHRVVGADTSLTGYGGGLARKQWLLEHEGALMPRPLAHPAATGSWA